MGVNGSTIIDIALAISLLVTFAALLWPWPKPANVSPFEEE